MKIYIKDTQATKAQIYSRGITIDDFSQIIGINYPYMSRILNKRTALSPSLAKRIADELGKEIRDVFEIT